jgi:protein O-mannosyl-transferase
MKRTHAWFLIAIAIAVVSAYGVGGVAHQEFVYLDDGPYLFQNPVTAQGLTWAGIWHFFTTTTGGQYMPVTMVSYLPIVTLFGMKAPPQIWMNVMIHLANCALVVWVLHKFTRRFWPAAVVGMLFALHPIHVESVAWATERKDVLFMFFGLLALGVYADYARNPGVGRYLLVVGLYGLSMLSKAMLVTLPALLLVLDVWPLGRLPRVWKARAQEGENVAEELAAPPQRAWLILAEKIPLLLIGAAMSFVTMKSTVGIPTLAELPLSYRLGVAIYGYADYLGALIWPWDLCALYPMPQFLDTKQVVLKGALLLGISGACVWQWGRRPYLLIGWLWYLGTLAPVSGLLQAGNQARADRFVYWPFLGIYVALVWLAFDGIGGEGKEAASRRRVTAGMAVVALGAVLWAMTARQVGYWHASESLFQRILSVTGHNPQIRTALATYYVDRGEVLKAQEEFEIAVREKPDHVPALVPLAQIYAKAGYPQAALEVLGHVATLPGEPVAMATDGALLMLQLGRPEEALSLIGRCMASQPEDLSVRNNAGIILVWAGRSAQEKAQGLELLEAGVRILPGDAGALTNLGAAYLMLGRYGEAEARFIEAIGVRPGYVRAYGLLGRVYEKAGDAGRAGEVYRAGLAVDAADEACIQGLERLTSRR